MSTSRVVSLWRNIFFVLLILPRFLIATVSDQHSLFPTTSEEVKRCQLDVEANVLQTIDCLISIPDDQKTYENTMKPWNRLAMELVVHFSKLTALVQTNFPSKIDAE